MEKRLYRNDHNKVIAGVSSGLADYMQVDITIIRLLFVLSTIFLAGTGLLVYIIMWIVVPVNNDPVARYNKFNDFYQQNQGNNMFNSPNAFNNPANAGEQTKWNTPNAGPEFNTPFEQSNFKQFSKGNDTGRTIGGLILLILGIYFLLKQMGFMPEWFNIFKIYKLWPLAIVAVGISLIFRNQRRTEWDNFKKTTEEAQRNTTAEAKPPVADVVVEEKKDPEQPSA